MKNFLVLLFYLTGPIASVYSFIENMPPHPWFFKMQMQKLRPRHLTIIPRPTHRQDISKFIYWKHLLELECFKEICGQIHFKDRSGYRRPFEMIRHRQMPAFRNDGAGYRDQIPNFYKTRENQAQSQPPTKTKYSGNERIILWPSERNFTEKQADVSPIKQNSDRSKTVESATEKPKGNPKESTPLKDFSRQRMDHRHPANFQSRTTEPKDAFENFGIFSEEDSPRRIGPGDDTLPEFFQKPGVMGSSTSTYSENTPYGFRQQVNPSRIQPYEVEEIIEEKFLVDVDEDAKGEDSFKPFAEKKVSGKDIRNEMAKTEARKKTDHFQSVIDGSVNTILKGLISPVMNTASSPGKDVLDAVLPLEQPEKQPIAAGVKSTTPSDAFRTLTSYTFSEKPNEIIFDTPWNRQQTYARLKKIQPKERNYSWQQQTAEAIEKIAKKLFKPDTRVDNSRGFDLNPSFEKEYLRGFPLTDSPKKPAVTEAYGLLDDSPSYIFSTDEYQTDSGDDLGRKPMPIPEKIPELSPTDTLRSLDLLRNLKADYQPNIIPREGLNTTTQKVLENSENPSTPPLPPSELPDFASESVKELLPTAETITTDSKDSGAISNGVDAAITTQELLETVKYFSETDLGDVAETEHNFLEFSDHPISFDLFTTTIKSDSEKDQERIFKSSRRMHFGHEVLRTTVSNGISGTGQTDQRRSDILITDNLADYVDDENNLSTLSYLEKLKQNNPLLPPDPRNLTSDALIPFIPVVINDLREGRIPSEDIRTLSQALGKYWNPILALSNFTNLDMLPLIKMKDEKDLENVLENFLPEDKTSTTVGTTESDSRIHDDYIQSYDYMDEYKDLYKDILGQELGDKKRRFRPRRDAEDDLKTLEATREYFDSIEEERGDEESDYIFEDIIYDEVSNGEDQSVFELMEVSDVHIDKET